MIRHEKTQFQKRLDAQMEARTMINSQVQQHKRITINPKKVRRWLRKQASVKSI